MKATKITSASRVVFVVLVVNPFPYSAFMKG
jgi:hypothetical protein